MRYAFLLILALPACSPSVDADTRTALSGLASVTYGEGTGFYGGSNTSVYSNDQMIFESWQSGGADRRETLIALPPGTYNALRSLALARIEGLGAYDGEACRDYGTDYVRVLGPGGDPLAQAAASCPWEPLTDLQFDLRELVSRP